MIKPTSTFAAVLTCMVRTAALPAALVLAASFAFAQQGEPARQGGGAGLTFNFGGVLNALRNATNKNTSGQPPILQKRADAVGTPSGGNYTVNWVISYANTSPQTLVNALVRDGPIATIIPSSLQQPAGWSQGVTNALPLPANSYAQWTAASVAPHGLMTATFPPPIAASMTVAGSGDQVFQPLTYCSGPKPFHWTSIEVKGAPLGNYGKFIVKVLSSANNAVLFTKDLKATGQLQSNITGIDTQTLSQPLKIEIEYVPKPGMGTTDKPYLEVRYDAPAPEFCFQSTHTCQQGKITNTVEAQDPFDPNKSVKAQAEVAQPQTCGLPPCVACGTANTPTCPPCGQAGQAPCPACDCGTPPPPPPPPPLCVPGTPGWPLCLTCASPPCIGTPPPPPNPVCLTGDCAPRPPVSVGEEYKAPKVTCVRKAKPVEEAPKKVAPKPMPKPVVVAAPVAPADANAAPKPKPKPRPKSAQPKAGAQDDDC